MSGEHTSNATNDHNTAEEHDCHIRTGNMSGETTSNRKRKQETTDQCDHRLENAQEKARCKRAEETPDQCDRWFVSDEIIQSFFAVEGHQ